jgi:hypothetical protein
MADIEALSDLKSAFGQFDDMTALIGRMQNYVEEITQYNQEAAGSDKIGQQYHTTVDQPTTDLVTLMANVYNTVNMTGQNGQDTSDRFNTADEDGASLANGGS